MGGNLHSITNRTNLHTQQRHVQASCEKDLAAAEPLVAQAEAALDTLNKKDLGEAKSLKKPPAGVDDITAVVIILLEGVCEPFLLHLPTLARTTGGSTISLCLLALICMDVPSCAAPFATWCFLVVEQSASCYLIHINATSIHGPRHICALAI